MDLFIFTGIVLTVFILSFGISAWFLRWLCRPLRIESITYKRALAILLFMTCLSLVGLAVNQQIDEPGLKALALLLFFAAVWWGYARMLRTKIWKGLVAMLLMMVFNIGLHLPIQFWVLEGFVVPTGGVAPTIYGQHLEENCRNCGFLMAVDIPQLLRDSIDRNKEVRTGDPIKLDCPMCRYQNLVLRPVIKPGDRILAEKLLQPDRWDVVVFKVPYALDVQFVERMVGLPGEHIQIAHGEVYVNGRVLSKPPGTAEDLWFLVHDTDYRPIEARPHQPRWKPVDSPSQWTWSDAGWRFGSTDEASHELIFSEKISDEHPYNALKRLEKIFPVNDIKLTCEIGSVGSGGSFSLNWVLGDVTVNARIAAGRDWGLTVHDPQTGDEQLASTDSVSSPVRSGDQISLAIRDGYAYLMHNDNVVAQVSIRLPRSLQDAARVNRDAYCRISLSATDCELTVSRITVHRDVYYRRENPHGLLANDIHLGSDESYMLGDNSALSHDSRYWDIIDPSLEGLVQIGAVPGDLLIGVARCIYWPLSRRHLFQ